ncbi:hypothetical protein TWF281_002865 [Arthrobotrys megalospora]
MKSKKQQQQQNFAPNRKRLTSGIRNRQSSKQEQESKLHDMPTASSSIGLKKQSYKRNRRKGKAQSNFLKQFFSSFCSLRIQPSIISNKRPSLSPGKKKTILSLSLYPPLISIS